MCAMVYSHDTKDVGSLRIKLYSFLQFNFTPILVIVYIPSWTSTNLIDHTGIANAGSFPPEDIEERKFGTQIALVVKEMQPMMSIRTGIAHLITVHGASSMSTGVVYSCSNFMNQ